MSDAKLRHVRSSYSHDVNGRAKIEAGYQPYGTDTNTSYGIALEIEKIKPED
jgi:hypothetical protein